MASANARLETYRKIRGKLLDGSVRSPKDLSRRGLANTLDESPSNVQWALARMEAEGLLESRPQSGTHIRKLSPREYRNLYDVRKLIEPYAAARAAHLITPDLLAKLEATCREMDSLPAEIAAAPSGTIPPSYVDRTVRLEMEFHGTILAAAQNPEAARIVEHTQILTHLARELPLMTREELVADSAATLAGHREILEAVRLGDGKAARRAMRKHLIGGLSVAGRRLPE
jgi:DNA-binding GntR family transcriptional regulator